MSRIIDSKYIDDLYKLIEETLTSNIYHHGHVDIIVKQHTMTDDYATNDMFINRLKNKLFDMGGFNVEDRKGRHGRIIRVRRILDEEVDNDKS